MAWDVMEHKKGLVHIRTVRITVKTYLLDLPKPAIAI